MATLKNFTGKIAVQDALSQEQKASFRNSYRVVQLPAGFVLWRFISKWGDKQFGAFWMDDETMYDIMQSFQNSGVFSATHKDYVIRESLAVIKKWSAVSVRVKIILLKEVVCYIGEVGTQKDYVEVENENLIGGGKVTKFLEKRIGTQEQYVIPRFRELPNYNAWAKVAHVVNV
jgi:hypothetical protein